MKIKTLTSHGLKAGDFTHDLAPVNVIVGDNFKGKTSRLEAIRLGLMGYLPELGNKPGLTFALARGVQMDVRLDYDDGCNVDRRWKMDRGTVKLCVEQDGPLQVPAVLMDPNEYFSLGDKDRMRYVFGLTKSEELEGKPVADVLISKVKTIKIEDHNESHEAAIRDLVQVIDDGDRTRHDAEQPVQEWLESLVKDMRDRLKLAKGNADRMAKTVQGLTQIQATEDEGAAANMERQLATARQELSDAIARQAVLLESVNRIEKVKSERLELSTFLQDHGDVSIGIKDNEASLKAIQGMLTDLRIKRSTIGMRVQELAKSSGRRADLNARLSGLENNAAEIAASEKELAELEAKTAGYKSETQEHSTKAEAMRQECDQARNKVAYIEQEIQERTVKHEQDMAADKCPHCGAKGKGWKKHIEAEFAAWSKEKAAALSDLVDYVAGAKKGLDILTESLRESTKDDDLQRAWSTDKIQLAGEIRLMKSSQQQRAQLLTDLEALGLETGEGQKITAEQATIEGKIKELASQQTTLEETLVTLRADQSAWEQATAKLAGMGESTEDVDAMRQELLQVTGKIVDLNAQIKTLSDRQQKHTQAMHDSKRNAQAIQEHQGYVAEVQVTKTTVDILEALQGELVKQAFGQILERANKVTAGILRSALDYKDGEIGRWEGATWISHQTFSGSEKALAYAGISVALAWESPIKIILLDELSRFDADHSSELLERLKELVERGFIDQAVCAGTHCDFVPEGVNVIRL